MHPSQEGMARAGIEPATFRFSVMWSRWGRPRMRENRVRSLAEVELSWRRGALFSLIRGAGSGAAHCCHEHAGPTLFIPVRFLRATASL